MVVLLQQILVSYYRKYGTFNGEVDFKIVECPSSFNHSIELKERVLKKLKGSNLVIYYRFNEDLSNPKLGITISSKIAKAHVRNKFKRQIREIFRLNQHSLDKNLEILVISKKASKSR